MCSEAALHPEFYILRLDWAAFRVSHVISRFHLWPKARVLTTSGCQNHLHPFVWWSSSTLGNQTVRSLYAPDKDGAVSPPPRPWRRTPEHQNSPTVNTFNDFTGRTAESRWPGSCRSPRTEVPHSTRTEIPCSCPCLGGIPGKPFPYAAPQLIPVQCRSFCVCRAGLSAMLILHMQPQRGCVVPPQRTTLKLKQKPRSKFRFLLRTRHTAACCSSHHPVLSCLQPAASVRIRFVAKFNCGPLLTNVLSLTTPEPC